MFLGENGMGKICKIVCFDEESVTDYVQIVAGGELEKTTELLNTRNTNANQEGELGAKAGLGGVFKALIGWDVHGSTKISEDLEFSHNKMVKNILKNTILCDFLNLIEGEEDNKKNSKFTKGTIRCFKGYKIYAEENSLSYIVMVSPYLSMLKNGSSIPAGDFSIAVDKMDDALRQAKGYYELVGIKGKSRTILRFNINSFRNSYTISDLLKMDLIIYGIKVGRTALENLNVSKELGMNISIITKDNPSYEDSDDNEEKTIDNPMLDVYDVLLAGVEAE